MFKFLMGKAQRWAINEQRQEAQQYLDELRGCDAETLALGIAVATHIRNFMFSKDLFRGKIGTAQFNFDLIAFYDQLQKDNNLFLAAGVRTWIHTNRATVTLSLRPIVQESWKLLFTSIDIVEHQTIVMKNDLGIILNIDGYRMFPTEYEWIRIPLPADYNYNNLR
jgi:hypothetical protein